jgi:hypothetical protein
MMNHFNYHKINIQERTEVISIEVEYRHNIQCYDNIGRTVIAQSV